MRAARGQASAPDGDPFNRTRRDSGGPVIALLGPFGHGNLGDAATQDSAVGHWRRCRPDARLVAISMYPDDTFRRHGLPTFCYHARALAHMARQRSADATAGRGTMGRLLDRLKAGLEWRIRPLLRVVREVQHVFYAARVVRRLDLLMISGSGQLDDTWNGAWEHPYALFKWTLLARLAGARVAVVSVGVGDLKTPVSRRFGRWTLKLAQYASFRKEAARAMAVRLTGAADGAVVNCDLAFGLPAVPARQAGAGQRPVVALGPIPYCHPRLWPERDAGRYAAYVGQLRLLAAGLVERGFDVRYIVGHVSPDLEAIADAMRQHESSPVEAAHVAVAPIASVSELLAALRSCDAVVSSRYHGVVLSELLALPVMAVSYERKIDDQMRDFGLERYVLPIGEFSAAQALPMFDRLWGERDGIRLRLAVLAADRTRRVAEQFDLLASRHLPPPAVPATACSEGT